MAEIEKRDFRLQPLIDPLGNCGRRRCSESRSNRRRAPIWHGQKFYNGVAILSRGVDPIERRCGLPGDPDDSQPLLEAEISGLVVGCLSPANGNPAPGPKFDYKLRWFDRLISYRQNLLKARAPTVLCGDYNVVSTPIDAVVPRRWIGMRFTFPEPPSLCGKARVRPDRCGQAHPSGKGGLYVLEPDARVGKAERSCAGMD